MPRPAATPASRPVRPGEGSEAILDQRRDPFLLPDDHGHAPDARTAAWAEPGHTHGSLRGLLRDVAGHGPAAAVRAWRREARCRGPLTLLRRDGGRGEPEMAMLRVPAGGGACRTVALVPGTGERVAAKIQRRKTAIGRAVKDGAVRLLGVEEWETVVPALLSSLGDAAEASGACLLEHGGEGGTAAPFATRGEWAFHAEAAGGARLRDGLLAPPGAEACARALELDEPMLLHPGAAGGDGEARSGPDQARAVAIIPVRAGNAAWGVLAMESRAGCGLWNAEEMNALRDAADILGAAIQRRRALTAQGLSQAQIRQAQRLEAVGQLAGGVAHDFNNLLMVIRGNLDLLLLDSPEQDPTREELEQIRAAAERASGLTRQLLAFSRLQVLAPEVLDLNRRVQEMLRMLTRLIGEDVRLDFHPAADVAHVKVDPCQLEQIVMNLVVNARDALPGGGTITVRTERVEITAAEAHRFPYTVRPGSYTQLVVADTGHGMDEATLRRLFEPFFTTKENGKGTGLGLPMVYGIVKQSGGYVWVDSEPGAGTVFRVCLPAVGSEEREREPVAREGALPQGAGTVLLVEDEPSVRRVAFRILERGGYEVLEACDGRDAVRVSEHHDGPIDLLVTDVVMPGMNGAEAARRIGLGRPETKVLYMSGYTDDRLVLNGVAEDGLPFIQKPFDPLVLLETVGRLIE